MTKPGEGILKLKCPCCGKQYQSWRSQYVGGKHQTCGKSACKQKHHTMQVSKELEAKVGMPLADLLRKRYEGDKVAILALAKELGVSSDMTKRLMVLHGIAVRTPSEQAQIMWQNDDYRQMQLIKGLNKVAKGKESSQWRGGGKGSTAHRTTEQMTIYDIREKFNEQVRDRDGRRCTRCGITEEQYKKETGRRLDVHHKIPYDMDPVFELDRCETVCRSCHVILDRAFVYVL